MPQLPQLYPYKPGPIERIVLPGEIVGLWVSKTYLFYQVEYIEQVMESDPVQINLGAIAAAAAGVPGQTAITQLQLLELPKGEFGQFRARVIDDFNALVLQGRADQRHKLSLTVAEINRYTNMHDPCGHTTEFYVYEDQNDAWLQGFNQTDYALTISRVNFYGYRYVLGDLLDRYNYPSNTPDHWTRVPCTARI